MQPFFVLGRLFCRVRHRIIGRQHLSFKIAFIFIGGGSDLVGVRHQPTLTEGKGFL